MLRYHHPTRECDGAERCRDDCPTRQQVAKRKGNPSFMQRIKEAAATVARGAGSIVDHIAAGLPGVSEAEKAERLATCEACPEFQPNRTCGACGCYMDVKAGWGEQLCPLDKWPKLPIVCNMGAGGIGDALLGSCAINGLRKDRRVVYKVRTSTIPFVQLLDLGETIILPHDWDESAHDWPKANLNDLQMNTGHAHELQIRGRYPRLQRFCRNVGGVTPALPKLRERERMLEIGREHAGAVALAPFSACQAREYPVSLWQELERLLIEAGHKTVVLASHDCDMVGGKVIGQPAEKVAGTILNARVLIGNDSGLAHLSAIMGVPTIVLCAHTTGPEIYGFYGPHVRFLDGHMACKGCWWQPPYNQQCEPRCPNVATITPAEILAVISKIQEQSA